MMIPTCRSRTRRRKTFAAGKTTRTIVNLPPGTAKSFIFAVCLPAWTLAHDPSASIMVVEHSKKLAKDTTRRILKILTSKMFRRNFPTRIDERWKGAGDFGTTKGGSVFATSIGGTITGYRADLVIVDDPLSIKDGNNIEQIDSVNQTFDDEISSRTRDEDSRIVVVMHRLHENDLSGHLIKQGGYDVLAIPLLIDRDTSYRCRYAVWHRKRGEQIRAGRYSKKELRDLAFRPSFPFLYQQGKGGGTSLRIRTRHFFFFEGRPDRSLPFVFSIDTAQKRDSASSRTALQVWQTDGTKHFLVYADSTKRDYFHVWELLDYLVGRYPPAMILIEDTASGSALIAHAEARLSDFTVKGIIPIGSKFERIRKHFRTISRRRVCLPTEAHWVPDWIEEIVTFPEGDYTDHVDALSMYLDFMATRPCLIPPEPRGGGLCATVTAHGVKSQISASARPSPRGNVASAKAPPLAQSTGLRFENGRPSLNSSPPVHVETRLGPAIIQRR
jgi:predicted phage terminase large subunit-like protein